MRPDCPMTVQATDPMTTQARDSITIQTLDPIAIRARDPLTIQAIDKQNKFGSPVAFLMFFAFFVRATERWPGPPLSIIQ